METYTTGAVSRGAVGGIIGGVAGAMVGSSTASKSTVRAPTEIRIYIRNIQNPCIAATASNPAVLYGAYALFQAVLAKNMNPCKRATLIRSRRAS